MERLIIKNIGPIKNVDITLNKINVFIGAQSSGKSTISKILCHCQWVEKTCYLNDKEFDKYEKKGEFYDSLVEHHRLEGYFNKTASIKYIGTSLTITYTHSSKRITIKKTENTTYRYPRISYIPSERNLVAAISNFSKYNGTNDVIAHFGYDWTDAKEAILKVDLSKVLERKISYEYKNGKDYIKDGDAKIALKVASSGILSMLPLYLTVLYMCDTLYKKERATSVQKRNIETNLFNKAIGILDKVVNLNDLFKLNEILPNCISKSDILNILETKKKNNEANKTAFRFDLAECIISNIEQIFKYKHSQLFIEEPEQNLFPKAQMKFVNEFFLLLNSTDKKHNTVITTHSPYVLFAINNCIMRAIVKDSIPEAEKVSLLTGKAFINAKEISIYQIEDGGLKRIQDEDGNLDDNFINDAYKANASEYFSLLNYYDDGE